MNKSNLCKILAFSALVLLISGISLQVMAQTEKGIEFYNSWEFNKAEKAFREILKNRPDDVQASYYLGLSLLMQEKYQEALDVFQKEKASIDKTASSGKAGIPDKGQMEIVLTRVYLGLKRYPEALKCLEAAEKVKANPADIHTFRGAYYLEKDNPENEAAVKELEKAIELDSQNAYAYYYAGYAYVRLGNPKKAVDMFRMFLNLAPYAPEAGKAKFLIDSLC